MDLSKTKIFREIVKKSKTDKNIISLILFGSYVNNTQKPNSDIDIAIIRKKNTLPSDFEILSYQDKQYDIMFFDKLPDYIKIKILTEGKILALNNEKTYYSLRRKFIHSYLDEMPYFEKNLNKLIANV